MNARTEITKFLALITGAAAFVPTTANSEGLCTGVKIALREAGNQFISLRQEFDFTFGEYKAKLSMGELRTCRITTDNVSSTIKCAHRFDLPEDGSTARFLFDQISDGVSRCLGSNIDQTRSKRSEDRIIYNFAPTGDDIKIAFFSSTSSVTGNTSYRVELAIRYTDPTHQ